MAGEPTPADGITINTLGPLVVAVDGHPVHLAPSRRRLLSILMLEPRRVTPTDVLIDRMWGEEPPATARTALHVNISELRRTVPVVTTSAGYRVDDCAVIHDRFHLENLVTEAEAAKQANDWPAALSAAQRAASLWRGRPFADIADEPFAAGAIARIDELFLVAADAEVEALLALGRNDPALLRLGDLIERHPFHDRLRRHLMLALYRSGRQGESLRSYQAYRKMLGETMGIEPGEDLRALEDRILLHDPELGVAPASPAPHNLPAVSTSFIGRDDDVRSIVKDLEAARLVTIIGGPGFGKTRLATEVGRAVLSDYQAGVWFVPLGGVIDSRGVTATIAAVAEYGEQTESLEQVAAALRARPLLLILDNCEHLIEPVSRLLLALTSEPGLCRVLATSRRRLGVEGESILRLSPLEPRIDESVALLADRIRTSDRGFTVTPDNLPQLLQLSSRLEGIPLALELVAPWLHTLGLDDVNRLLDRVRSESALATAFDWSLALLPETDREVARALAVFESPFTLERATAVCADFAEEPAIAGSISRLVDASLLGMAWSGRTARYRMPPPIRELAWQQLDSKQVDQRSERHAVAFVRAAIDAGIASLRGGQAEVFATLDVEIVDHRRALSHLRTAGRWTEFMDIVDGLARYWYGRFLGWEGRQWLGDVPSDVLDPRGLAHYHHVAGFLAWGIHDYVDADLHYAALHHLGVELADPAMEADGLYGRGLVHQKRRYLDGAAMLDEAARIYETLDGHELQFGECLLFRGIDEAYTGDVTNGIRLLDRAIELLEGAGHLRQVSKAHRWLAHCAWRRGNEPDARRHAQSAASLARSVGDDIALAGALVEQAHIEISWGDTREAALQLEEALRPIPESDEIDRAQVLLPVSRLAVRVGETALARAILAHIDDVYERHGWRPLDEIVGVGDLRTATVDVEPSPTEIGEGVGRLLAAASDRG